jgi:hypothetical protein
VVATRVGLTMATDGGRSAPFKPIYGAILKNPSGNQEFLRTDNLPSVPHHTYLLAFTC